MVDRPQFDAIVLDVDGTVYLPGPVRRRMALQLVGACLLRPSGTWRALRVIRVFRRSLEELRSSDLADHSAEQFRRTVQRTGLPDSFVRSTINEWMLERPLKSIGAHPRPGLHRFLRLALRHGIRLGAFSEYPCEKKLESLGIRDSFTAVVSSHDPQVRRFKPDPTGFLHTARLLNADPERTLVIGDREDADGAGAGAAGMAFLCIGGTKLPSFEQLCPDLTGEPD